MITQDFDGATVIGAPRGWDPALDGEVQGLPVVATVDTLSGLPSLVSVWKPDADELAMLLAGGAIRLAIMLPQHPIVALGILTPEKVAEAGCRDHRDMSALADQSRDD